MKHAPETAVSAGLDGLLRAVRAYLADTPEIAAFVGGALDGPLAFVRPEPRAFPIVSALASCPAIAVQATEALVDGVVAAAPAVTWSHSYTDAQVGTHFLENSAWFNLASPEGPFVSPEIRVSIGYWERGLVYPDHKHGPEEIYLVLAGAARFWREGSPPELVTAGGTYRNPGWAIHGAAMEPGPLLAMAFWRGDRLNDRAVLVEP